MKIDIERFLRNKEEILNNFHLFFQDDTLEKLARESRFIERSTSKLTGWMFLELHLLLSSSGKEFSLNQMCDELYARYGIQLSKQSLDERFNTFAVKFIRKCFEYTYAQTLAFQQLSSTHPHFKRVILTDASSWQLPAHLAAFYCGNGGDTSGSSVKIHQQYDLLNGSVLHLDIGDGKNHDAAWLQKFDYSNVQQELHLLDLGYFKLAHLQALHQAGSFFISRYKTGINIFVKDAAGNFSKLNWSELLSALKTDQSNCLQEVYLGKEKLKVRLVVEPLPEEVALKRQRKEKKKQANQTKNKQHKDWQTSQLKNLLMHYNIFITNTTETQLALPQIALYYKLRWQVEILFKIWKSIMEIDKVGKMSIFRFECYLYSRLIAILLSTQVHSMLKAYLEGGHDRAADRFELSEWKVMKHLKKK